MSLKKSEEPQKLIDIGDLSLWRKTSDEFSRKRGWVGDCPHINIIMDDVGEVVTCKDCGKQISAFWALQRFYREYSAFTGSLKARAEQVKLREEKGLVLKSAQEIEKAWRSRTMVPACPHCRKAILPTDGFGGLMYNKAGPEGAEKSFKKTAVVLGL